MAEPTTTKSMAEERLRQFHLTHPIILRSGTNVVTFETNGSNDLSAESPIKTMERVPDGYQIVETTLGKALADPAQRRLVTGVFRTYGLTDGDLQGLLKTPSPDERSQIAGMNGMNSEEYLYRLTAVRGMVGSGNPYALQVLLTRGIRDPHPMVRAAALRGAAKLDIHKALPLLKSIREQEPFPPDMTQAIDESVAEAIRSGKITQETWDTTQPADYPAPFDHDEFRLMTGRLFRRTTSGTDKILPPLNDRVFR